MKLRLKPTLLLMVYLPVIGILAVTLLIIKVNTEDLMAEQNHSTLEAAVETMRYAYDNLGEGSYIQLSNGAIYKGDFCVTSDSRLVDEITEKTGCVATFFWENKRVMTSIRDAKGERLVGTTMDDEAVIDAVLKRGESYFNEHLAINNIDYSVLYVPVYQPDSSEIVGMVFMGIPTADAVKAINGMMLKVSLLAVAIIIAVSFSTLYFANGIANSAKSVGNTLSKLAEGDFAVSVDAKVTKRVDELGEMGRTTVNMIDRLKGTLRDVVDNSGNLLVTSETLDQMAKDTAQTITQVENAVNDIATGAGSQAEDTAKASQNVMEMGSIINDTVSDIENLTGTAGRMASSGSTAMDILAELKEVNERAIKAIDTVYEQTHITNESARKIHEATDIIASIAEETNLLSLNASIEAARAGDAGRGFAVVADQIQKLAEQSNNSALDIENITMSLIEDSDKSVEIMNDVKEIMNVQYEKMNTTGEAFTVVSDGIEETKEGIDQIGIRARKLDEARKEIVDIIQSLTAIAEENAASTEETSAAAAEVAAAADSVSRSAVELKDITQALENSISGFKF